VGSLLLMSRAVGQRTRSLAAVQAHAATLSIVAITLAAFLLRLRGLTDKSVWYDEAFVVTLARMSIPDMVRGLIELDPHPPLYYAFMHFWLLLGTDPFTMRLPSVVFSSLSVPLLYGIGSRFAGPRIGLGAAALLAVSSFHVEWAQEVRMYALLGLLCLGSLFFLLRALDHGGLGNWAAHSALTAACMYTQLNAVFFLAAQAFAVVTLIGTRQRGREKARPWFLSQLAAALLFFPWLPAFLAQNDVYRVPNLAWTTARGVEGVLFQQAYGQLPYWHLTMRIAVELRDLLVVGAVAISLLGAWSLRLGGVGALLLWLSLGTVGLLAAAGCWKGIFLAKTIIAASFAWYLLMVAGLAALRWRVVVVAGLAALLLLNVLGLVKYYSSGSQEDWQAAAGYLSRQMKPEEVAFVDCSAGLLPLDYHLEGLLDGAEFHGVPFRPWAVEPPPLTEEDYRRVDEIARGKSGIWLVVYRNGFPDADGQLLGYLSERYSLADARSLAKIRLFQFLPRAARVNQPREAAATPSRPIAAGVSGNPSSDVASPIYLGAWVGERVNIPGDVERFENAIGKQLAIVHRYSDNPPFYGSRFDSEWASWVNERGSIPMLSWQPNFGRGTRSLASVAVGDQDDYISRWADQIRDWGRPLFFRMMWEQNSPWFSWKAYQEPQISEYVAAWRHIVAVFRQRGAGNVTFVWSPHVGGNGAGEVMPTYPGDDYVDWVALDGYPFRNGRGDFEATFGPDYDLLTARVQKPIMIAETSVESWSDELKAQWIRDILLHQIPARFPRLKALVWFDEKDTNGADFSILQDQGPLSQAAFREGVASSRYLSR